MSAEVAAYWPAVIAAYSVILVGMLSPGPSVALLLGIAGEQGRRAAMIAVAGIAVGTLGLGLVTTLGLSVLCARAPWFKVVVQYLGAALLFWRALRAARKAILKTRVQVAEVPRHMTPPQLFSLGFAVQISNMGALAIWVAAVSTGRIAIGPQVLLVPFAIGGALMSAAVNAAYAFVLSSRPARQAYNRARRAIEAVLALFLAAMAVRIVMRAL